MVLVGITLQPERRYLDLLAPLFLEEAEYFEVTPETTWRVDESGALVANSYFREFRELLERTGKPVVAHGVGLSLGTVAASDEARFARWLARIAEDHAVFGFRWYTDHFGATQLGDRSVVLPIDVPRTEAMAEVMRARLAALQAVVPDVGFENSVLYFLLGGWYDEPAFFARVLARPRTHLLLDLHNVFTMAVNFGLDAGEYLERVDLARVIEIHLSGGTRSDPAWLPSGETRRLDSHDAAVPEAVWRIFERVAPRCPNLRGVTVERMEGTVEPEDVAVLRGELRRAKQVVGGLGT